MYPIITDCCALWPNVLYVISVQNKSGYLHICILHFIFPSKGKNGIVILPRKARIISETKPLDTKQYQKILKIPSILVSYEKDTYDPSENDYIKTTKGSKQEIQVKNNTLYDKSSYYIIIWTKNIYTSNYKDVKQLVQVKSYLSDMASYIHNSKN